MYVIDGGAADLVNKADELPEDPVKRAGELSVTLVKKADELPEDPVKRAGELSVTSQDLYVTDGGVAELVKRADELPVMSQHYAKCMLQTVRLQS